MSETAPGTGSTASGRERRRSQRILLVIPLTVAWHPSPGMRVMEPAETILVSRHGALLRIKSRIPLHAPVELSRRHMALTRRARVVWVGPLNTDNADKLAVELEGVGDEFWGVVIPPADPVP